MKSMSGALRMPQRLSSFFRDTVVITFWGIVSILILIDVRQAGESLVFTLQALLSIAPFFLLAIFLAAYAKASGADQLIARAFSGKPAVTIVAASLAGAISPFCSCGVIPIIAAMLASGVPLAPVMAFFISSPIMDPEMFILTSAGINFQFALAKTITALFLGLAAGTTVWALRSGGWLADPMRKIAGCGCGPATFRPEAPVTVVWLFGAEAERRRQFSDGLRNNGLFLAKWMTLAFLLESLMVAYIPPHWIASLVGQENAFAIPLAALVGVPAYMNGYAAIPLISGLMSMGMTAGAALAFATAGAVSSIPAAIAVYALVRRPIFWLYIALGLSGSMVAGYLYEFWAF